MTTRLFIVRRFFLLCSIAVLECCCEISEYVLNPNVGLGKRFDGVGAISGGGATSKLLVNYPPEQQNDILDFLFKPNFGASLHMLKVEIGGDAQSSEGTEASHMHNEWDENYERGYEWWMMTEAKRRNPDIRLSALAWGFPSWLGSGTYDPFHSPNVTSDYIARWILGAKKRYNLDIDYIGIWNEKPYSSAYIKNLRQTLNDRGLDHVMIIGGDSEAVANEMIVRDILHDAELYKAVDIIGFHYPGSYSSLEAQNSLKPLWASEDWSDSASEDGAGCMARLLNQNYVLGYMTSLTAWNIINSYYDNLQYGGIGLMRANEPWSGYYETSPPVWATAHTTQFVKIGWTYLKHGYGVASLKYGGSIVSLISPDKKDLTVVIETMDTSTGKFCLRDPTVPTKVLPQNITLVLQGNLSSVSSFYLWRSALYGNESTILFQPEGIVKVDGSGHVIMALAVNSIYTLTTLPVGRKGEGGKVPNSKPFPLPYKDNFDDYPELQEPYCFTPQVGSFEIHLTNDVSHKKVLRQVVLQSPIHWCPVVQTTTIGVIGDYNWSDIRVTLDVFIPNVNATSGVYIAIRVDQASCTAFLAQGLFLFVLSDVEEVVVARDLERTDVVFSQSFTMLSERWYTMSLQSKNNEITASINGEVIYHGDVIATSSKGFVAFGTDNFGLADFDNLLITSVI